MDYDIRFTGAIVALATVICGLAFAALEARLPEAEVTPPPAIGIEPSIDADEPSELPAVCGTRLVEGDCTYY